MVRQLLTVGYRVLASDGAELGLVRAVAGPLFGVRDATAGDYWLPTAMIHSLAAGAVYVSFARNELASFVVAGH